MYVGSTRVRKTEEYVADKEFNISKRSIKMAPAGLRIFVEILSNAVDNVARSKTSGSQVHEIKVDVDMSTGKTSVTNDGAVVPIVLNKKEGIYNHSLIFGNLLTSSNYDDTTDRLDISGRNGFGAKASNVFSTQFTVTGTDPVAKKKLVQTWNCNMRETKGPVISKYNLKKGYTNITWTPDFAQFKIKGYTSDWIDLYRKYVVDTAMLVGKDGVKVYFNGELVPAKTLRNYANLYNGGEPVANSLLISYKGSDVFICPSDSFEAIAFSNRVYNSRGGVHVEAWCETVFRPIVENINKKNGGVNITHVKSMFKIFVVSTVARPEWDGQEKMYLEAPKPDAAVKKSQIAAILKWPSVIARIADILRSKEMAVLGKVEKKRGYSKVAGLDPANNSGGKRSSECSLCLCEGLSAKPYVVKGIERGVFGKKGRDWFGIYALRGKILNVRNFKLATVAKNTVVTDIIKSVKLRHDLDYTDDNNFKTLAYGRIIIIVDADVDGTHIAGLLLNLIHTLYPSLLRRKTPFVTYMQTPIVRVFLNKQELMFYDERKYREYIRKYLEKYGKYPKKKYYKGLGTSSDSDIRETFGQKMLEFMYDEDTDANMNKLFLKSESDSRKIWISKYDDNYLGIDWEKSDTIPMPISKYLNKEVITYSISDCGRSLPSLMDGLKKGPRKVLYSCFKRNLNYGGKDLKVAQLAGYTAEHSGYHHGEQNLLQTITGLAASYIGSNNIPLLYRGGQFGSRMAGGKDAASGRYIFTKLDELTRLIFRQEDEDYLPRQDEDGQIVEPVQYMPILPMILVNGCTVGIGTGWSSTIPCYNPMDLVECIKVWLELDGNVFELDEDTNTYTTSLPEIHPWYREFTGEIKQVDDHKYTSHGRFERISGRTVRVTELPIGYWTDSFTDMLETMKEKKEIASYVNHSKSGTVDFTIKEVANGVRCDEVSLKLVKFIYTSNMVMFDSNQRIKKYESVDEIIDDYCKVRYSYYTKRRQHLMEKLKRDIAMAESRSQFVTEIIEGTLTLRSENGNARKSDDIVSELVEKKYFADATEDDDGEGESSSDFAYLFRMPMHSLTNEKVEKLREEVKKYQLEYKKLEETDEKGMWTADLDEFVGKYTKWLKKIAKDGLKPVSKKKGK